MTCLKQLPSASSVPPGTLHIPFLVTGKDLRSDASIRKASLKVRVTCYWKDGIEKEVWPLWLLADCKLLTRQSRSCTLWSPPFGKGVDKKCCRPELAFLLACSWSSLAPWSFFTCCMITKKVVLVACKLHLQHISQSYAMGGLYYAFALRLDERCFIQTTRTESRPPIASSLEPSPLCHLLPWLIASCITQAFFACLLQRLPTLSSHVQPLIWQLFICW